MGIYLNPGNQAFRDEIHSEIYVDKTGLIEYTNRVSETSQKYICSSRPRRFGKSYAADMLAAYYSRGCDSSELFASYEIVQSKDYEKYLNQCYVIHIDMQWAIQDAGGVGRAVRHITEKLLGELEAEFRDVPDHPQDSDADGKSTVFGALSEINAKTGARFVVIIDEWDAPIRDTTVSAEVQDEYINFLRGMFKGSAPARFIQLAYLTGILPIKRLMTQSALNEFDEFTMLWPGPIAPYIGFTAREVESLCVQYDRDYDKVRDWYDGYYLDGYQIYNPRAVNAVMLTGQFRSYWSSTGTYESIVPYINIDYDGLKTAIIEMLSGGDFPVNTDTFQNDMVSFRSRDDVITLLIHMGYLAFRQETRTAYIPNEEIRLELQNAVRASKWDLYREFFSRSEQILEMVMESDEHGVAAEIEKIHDEYASSIQYNSENSLSGILAIAFLGTLPFYFKPIRELPAGRGFADFIYIPKPEYRGEYPALVVELKWNRDARTALDQIREKRYPEPIRQYTGNIRMVGIGYDKRTKRHTCRIEKA